MNFPVSNNCKLFILNNFSKKSSLLNLKLNVLYVNIQLNGMIEIKSTINYCENI